MAKSNILETLRNKKLLEEFEKETDDERKVDESDDKDADDEKVNEEDEIEIKVKGKDSDKDSDNDGDSKKDDDNDGDGEKKKFNFDKKSETNEEDEKDFEADELKKEEEDKEEDDKEMKEHLAAMFSGTSLNEDFRSKAATLFETAVRSSVSRRMRRLQERAEHALDKRIALVESTLVDRIDVYLQYVVENWMKENQLAVDNGLRLGIVEDFITGMRSLFEEHYVEIPEGKEDLLETTANALDATRNKLNSVMNNAVALNEEVCGLKKELILRDLTEGLAMTDAEKLRELAENVEFSFDEDFKAKMNTIKEQYFPGSKKVLRESTGNREVVEEIDVTSANTARYLSALRPRV